MTDIAERPDGAVARVRQAAPGPVYLTVLEVAVLARCEQRSPVGSSSRSGPRASC
jgi:hypothetical protein